MTNTNKPLTLLDISQRWEHWTNDEYPRRLEHRLRSVGTFSEPAIERIGELSNELERLLNASPALRAIDFFLSRATTHAHRLDRYATIRTLEILDQIKGDPIPWPGWLPDDETLRERTLRDTEIGLVRLISLTSAHRVGPIATLDAGAISGELGLLHGIDLTKRDGGDFVVSAPGTLRKERFGYTMASPRELQIGDWATGKFETLFQATGPNDLLLYAGSATKPEKIQSSILMNVANTLKYAGIGADPTVRPVSIRNTAGRRAYEKGGLEAAAALLGHDDFNSVAQKIGLQSRKPVRVR